MSLFQRDMAAEVLEEFEVIKMIDDEERIVDYEYKVLLYVNNFNECLRNAG